MMNLAFFMHPAIFALAFCTLLVVLRKRALIFGALAFSYPVLVGGLIYRSSIVYKFAFWQFEFLFNFSNSNKLICLSFALVASAANLLALSCARQNLIFSGGIYFSLALFCVSAADFISMFVFLEMLMLCGAFLIALSNHQSGLKRARLYFLTHLFSGMLILIGIIWLLILAQSSEIVNLSHLLQTPHLENLPLYLLLIGLLINVAAFPFGFWLTSCYSASSSVELLYLLSFSTKVAIIILIKLFSGLAILKIFGAVTIIYSLIFALRENNLKKLLCYLTTGQLGFMIVAASLDNALIIEYLLIYTSMHILAKCLLILCFGFGLEKAGLTFCHELAEIDNFLFKFSLGLAVISMLSPPLTIIFYSKAIILSELDNYGRLAVFLFSIFTLLMLPTREYFGANSKIKLDLDPQAKLCLLLVSTILIVGNFYPGAIAYLVSSNASLAYSSLNFSVTPAAAKQAGLVILAIILAFTGKNLRLQSPNLAAKPIYRFSVLFEQFSSEAIKKWQLSGNFNYYVEKIWLLTSKIDVLGMTVTSSLALFFILLLTLAL